MQRNHKMKQQKKKTNTPYSMAENPETDAHESQPNPPADVPGHGGARGRHRILPASPSTGSARSESAWPGAGPWCQGRSAGRLRWRGASDCPSAFSRRVPTPGRRLCPSPANGYPVFVSAHAQGSRGRARPR